MEQTLATEAVDTVFPCVCDFLTFLEALQFRTINHRSKELAEEYISEDRCVSFLQAKLVKANLYVFADTEEWKESSQTDPHTLRSIFRGGKASLGERVPLRTLLEVIQVVKNMPMEAAIAYSSRYGRILIPCEEQVRCIADDFTEEERVNGHIYDPCPCPKGNRCHGCRLIDDIPARIDHVTTQGRVGQEGYSVDDFYACIRPSQKEEVEIELKKYFPVCVPNLPPTLICPVCSERTHRTLFLTELSYQSSESSPDFRSINQTFTPAKCSEASDHQAKRHRREETWRDRLFPKGSYPPAPYREVGIHKNVPIQHTKDQKSCISIHCEKCKKFGMLAPVVPCHGSAFPCETVRTHPQECSIRDTAYEADLGAVLVRSRCNANHEGPCFKAPMCTQCSYEVWHNVWEQRPNDGRNHAYINSPGINFVVSSSSCRMCGLRLCSGHSYLASVCNHSQLN